MDEYRDFRDSVRALINNFSMERNSDTPDFILANYLTDCLQAFDNATSQRTRFFYVKPEEDPKCPTSQA